MDAEAAPGVDEHPAVGLIQRAEQATLRMRTTNPHRALIRDMAVLIVQQAHIIDGLQAQLADKPRIIVPELIAHG